MMRAIVFLLPLLAACATPSEDEAALPVPPVPELQAVVPPAAAEVPKQVRAALTRAVPRELALAASPDSDGDEIRLVRLLHSNVVAALTALERDDGHHATAAEIQRARTAVKDLENHLAEFNAAHASK